MAQVNIQHMCGCGFKTSDAKEAVAHVDEHNHKMWTQGTVLPDIKPIYPKGWTEPRKQ